MRGLLSLGCLLLTLNGLHAKEPYLSIPYSPETPPTQTGVRSPTTQRICLNGKWDFLPIQGDKEFPGTLEFFKKIKNEKILPPRNADWDKILVPSMWAYYWGMAFLDENGKSYAEKWGNKIKRAWYRRKFSIPGEWDKNKRLILRFEAAAGFTKIFINGIEAGSHYGSLFPFEFDIADKADYDKENELLVYSVKRFRARRGELTVELPDGRQNQYGIYRNVWLKNEPDIAPGNIQIATSVRKKTIGISFELTNQSGKSKSLEALVDIVDENGDLSKKIGKKTLNLKSSETVKENFSKPWTNPKYWDVGQPNMYFMRIRVYEAGKLLCERQQRFGFREFWFDGPFFYLNGKKFTFRGDWIHTFWAGCPAEMYPDYMKLIIKQMKFLNFQGPRFSAVDSPEWLLDMLDEAGFPIIATGITPNYYGDPHPERLPEILEQTREWIRRDRNHPCILLWSTMNEATANSKFHPRYKWQKKVIKAIAEEDPTRPQYNDGHADNEKPSDFFTTGNLAGELTISCGHYGNLKVCPNDYIGFLNAPKYWPRQRPFIDGEEGVFGILPLYYPALAVRTAGIEGLFYNIEERRKLSGRWLNLIARAWRAWEIPGFIGFDSFRASWENPFPVTRKDYNRQYHKTLCLEYKHIDTPGPKGQLVIGHGRDDDPRANPWTKKYPKMQATSYAKYAKAAYAPVFATISRNWQSNYFSGDAISKKIDLVNDLREDAKDLNLQWSAHDNGKKLIEKTCSVSIPQGKVIQEQLNFTAPETKAFRELKLNVALKTKNGKELSAETLTINLYPKPDFSFLSSRKIMIFDPEGDTSKKLEKAGIKVPEFDLSKLNVGETELLLIGREAFAQSNPDLRESMKNYISSGGNVFFFRQKTKKKTSACLIDKSAPKHPVFQGLKPGIISNWKLQPDSEILKHPLNWPKSGRFNILALIGAAAAGRHEAAMIESYIGKGRLIACNLELTDSIPREPEAMILLRNILKEYSQPSKYFSGKTVYISSPEEGLLLKEPFWINAEHFSSGFENMDLSATDTLIIGNVDKIEKSSLETVRKKLETFKGNVLVLPQKESSFINSLLGEENKINIKRLDTCRGARKNAKGIVGFLNKGEDYFSQGLESFFQTCGHNNIGMPLDVISTLFENPKGWTPLLAPYDRLPGKNRGEFASVPIKDQLLIRKNIDGKNFILSCLRLPSATPAINRIYLTLLANLHTGSKENSGKAFSFANKKGDDWIVNCNGFIYDAGGAAQIDAVNRASDDDFKVGKLKSAGISLIRSGFFGLDAPFWRFIPGMRRHPGDLLKPKISTVKKDDKITISRNGIMLDRGTGVKMKYDSAMEFDKNGKLQMNYNFKVLEGAGKYKTALSCIRLDKNEDWTGKSVKIKDASGKETLFKWPPKGERCHKRIKAPESIIFEAADGIKWSLKVGNAFKCLILERGYHKGFELVLETNNANLDLKKDDAFSLQLSLCPQSPDSEKTENIFNAIRRKSILPISRFEKESPDAQKYFFINIVKKCNAPFKGKKWSDKKSSVFRLDELNGGDFYLNGTPFHIIDADTDELEGGDPGQAMSMIIMKGEYRPDFIEAVKNIQVGQKAKSLYFLQSAIYMNSPSGKWDNKKKLEMWKYRVNYEDGSSVTIPVIHHVNVKDWYRQNTDLPGAKITYVEKRNNACLGVWSQKWNNPEPEKIISSLDIESSGKGIPVILAITGKK